MVDFILDYFVMKYPTPLVSVCFGSVIPTFCSISVVFIIIIFVVERYLNNYLY